MKQCSAVQRSATQHNTTQHNSYMTWHNTTKQNKTQNKTKQSHNITQRTEHDTTQDYTSYIAKVDGDAYFGRISSLNITLKEKSMFLSAAELNKNTCDHLLFTRLSIWHQNHSSFRNCWTSKTPKVSPLFNSRIGKQIGVLLFYLAQ